MNTTEEKTECTETPPVQQDMYTFSKKKKIIFIVAAILFLILAWGFSFNMRSLAVRPQFSSMFGEQTPEFLQERLYYWNEVYSKAQGADCYFLQLNTGFYRPKNILQSYKALHEAAPNNQIYLSYYALYLAATNAKEARETFDKIIDKWKDLDRNNAMPYFLKAYVLSKDAIAVKKESLPKTEKKGVAPKDPVVKLEYEIKNQAAADLALAEYKAGLTKKYADCYIAMAIKKKLESANLERDPLGELHRISVSASCIPAHLVILEQDLAFHMATLAEMKAEKGNTAEALDLVKSGRTYLLLRLGSEPFNMLGYHPVNNRWLETAGKLNDKEMIAVYENTAKEFDAWWNRNKPDQLALKRHGGEFMRAFAPSIKVDIAAEDYKPERMINYLLLDQYRLASTFILWSIAIIFLVLVCGVFFLCKRKARWIQLPAKSYLYIGLFGLLIPLLIQLLWVHIPALSGRDLNLLNNQSIVWLLEKYQVLFCPIFFAIICCMVLVRKGNAKPLDCIWNLIFLFTVYLFLSSATLRIVQDAEISYYTKQDKLIHSETGFTVIGDRAVQELTGKLKKSLKAD